MKKIRVALLCGGKSAEHEISVISTQSVMAALDKSKYSITIIGIDKKGRWFLNNRQKTHNIKKLASIKHSGVQVGYVLDGSNNFTLLNSDSQTFQIDVVIPLLHGPYGEDGSIQGVLKIMNLPFVGAGVTGSALGMDKDVMKRLLRDSGIPIAKFLVFYDYQRKNILFQRVKRSLGLPFFVKPANLGSSVGVTKVHSANEFPKALDIAFSYDTKILIEQTIQGREIECSILGNEKITASIPGEVIPHDDFYSYQAKYVEENGAELKIPALLGTETIRKVKSLAIKTAKVLCVEGMGRVDFFLTDKGKLYVNEINTIPGFTNMSMYPKLWEKSGISFTKLLDILIELALQRFHKEQKLYVSYQA